MALYKVRGTLTGVTPIQLQNFKYQHPSEPLYKIRTPISQKRKKVSSMNKGGMARACGAIMEGRRKQTKFS